MHTTAMRLGKLFFDTYAAKLGTVDVVDIGAQDINGSLRQVCTSNCRYIGVDFVPGKGVDVILTTPYKLPFEDNSVDIVVSSSCFEHSEFFWVLFMEMMRILRPGGLCYINAPSNGPYHRYPVDCWRFYPDSGNALAAWAQQNGIDAVSLESFISYQAGTQQDAVWNDAVMVFLKGREHLTRFPDRMINTKKDFFNGYRDEDPRPINFQMIPEDMLKTRFLTQKLSAFLSDRGGNRNPEVQRISLTCSVCGGTTFERHRVLWQKLVNDWGLSHEEADYIDRQQGECCTQCRSNIRSIALANAILSFLHTEKTLLEAVRLTDVQNMSVLEINEAGNLHWILKQLRGHVFGAYPQVDIHAMPYGDNTFDLIVHSDTLEHVERPVIALRECLRILKPGGALCYTVPIVIGRMSRSRSGLPPSYHGNPTTNASDYMVHTEFGADAWTYLLEAGFSQFTVCTFAYPSGIAFLAGK